MNKAHTLMIGCTPFYSFCIVMGHFIWFCLTLVMGPGLSPARVRLDACVFWKARSPTFGEGPEQAWSPTFGEGAGKFELFACCT